MRSFEDTDGTRWAASAREEGGPDYKGRWVMVLSPEESAQGPTLVLTDVRWNGQDTARRTLETMSAVELRRRLRIARGRGASASPA